jgi:hypothetical protein
VIILLCLGTVWVGRAALGASARITLAPPSAKLTLTNVSLIHVRAPADTVQWGRPARPAVL